MGRAGAEFFFTEPTSGAQRRYEALRAYLVDGQAAAEVADRFGYSTASMRAPRAAERVEAGSASTTFEPASHADHESGGGPYPGRRRTGLRSMSSSA